MARRPAPESDETIRAPSTERSISRIAAMVGLHLTREMNKTQQAIFFTKAGFTAVEVAQMLQVSPNQVYAILSAARKKGDEAGGKNKKRN